MAAAAA